MDRIEDLERRIKGLEEALAQLQFRLVFAGETQPNQTYGPFPKIERCNCVNGNPQSTGGCPVHGIKT